MYAPIIRDPRTNAGLGARAALEELMQVSDALHEMNPDGRALSPGEANRMKDFAHHARNAAHSLISWLEELGKPLPLNNVDAVEFDND